ncbi:MAG: hypothetical protein NT143_00775 [Actinobacteria bacterium]|nr:hypothetical protein [Actinomycetota bacterium]
MRISRLAAWTAALVVGLSLVVAGVGCGNDGDGSSAQPARAASAISGAPRHLIYLSELKIQTVLERLLPNGPGPLERIATYRQLPARQTVLPPANRIARVDGVVLAPLPPAEIAKRLRRAINGTCNPKLPCRAHLVAIDDIGNAFKGRAGTRLNMAMRQLDAPSPWGSSYAKRVMMYVAYPTMKAMESPAEQSQWRGAIAAVAAGESYWLEMYNSAGVGQIGAINYDDWRNLPAASMRAITAHGGRVARAHFILGPSTGTVTGMPAAMCPSRQGCAWVATHATTLNSRIARNGTGVYRFGPKQLGALCVQSIAMPETDSKVSHAVVTRLCREWTRAAKAESTHTQG